MKLPNSDQIFSFLTKDISLRRTPKIDADALAKTVRKADSESMAKELADTAKQFLEAMFESPPRRAMAMVLLGPLLQMAVLLGQHSVVRTNRKIDRVDRLFRIFNTLTWALLAVQVGQLAGSLGWF